MVSFSGSATTYGVGRPFSKIAGLREGWLVAVGSHFTNEEIVGHILTRFKTLFRIIVEASTEEYLGYHGLPLTLHMQKEPGVYARQFRYPAGNKPMSKNT